MVTLGIDSETIENIELVIFDKDGTLIELYPYWSGIAEYRLDIIQSKLGFDNTYKENLKKSMGIDAKQKQLNAHGPIGLLGRAITLNTIVNILDESGYKNSFDICDLAFIEADMLSTKNFHDLIIPRDGMYDIINSLSHKKCKIAVATNDSSKRAKLIFDYLNVSNKIDIIVGIDMVENKKPVPDMINLILKLLHMDKKNTIMIGDSILDIEMGRNADVRSIAINNKKIINREFFEITKIVINGLSEIRVL